MNGTTSTWPAVTLTGRRTWHDAFGGVRGAVSATFLISLGQEIPSLCSSSYLLSHLITVFFLFSIFYNEITPHPPWLMTPLPGWTPYTLKVSPSVHWPHGFHWLRQITRLQGHALWWKETRSKQKIIATTTVCRFISADRENESQWNSKKKRFGTKTLMIIRKYRFHVAEDS